MQKFFQRIWQWFQSLYFSLLGHRVGNSHQLTVASAPPLSDLDYEFLYRQLLEGIAHGWHEGRVLKFFEQLGERGKTRLWVEWLGRFQEKVLGATPDLTLAARMMRLGELAQSFPKIEAIGHQSHLIARQIYSQQAGDKEVAIWEYGGPDAVPNFEDATLPADVQLETYTLEELITQLDTDAVLAQQIAQDLGLDSPDPQSIIEALLAKFPQAQNPGEPHTAQDWLALGLAQANEGQLEAAIASWEQALALDAELAGAWHNRGSALGNLGRLEEALVSFQNATRFDPQNAPAWQHQGAILEILGQPAEAIACYQRSLEINPQLMEAAERLTQLQSVEAEAVPPSE
jgi:tetratricopeptide (TPR) repeat protein